MSKKGDNEPATKGDVRKLASVVEKHNATTEKKYASIDQRFDGMDKKIDNLQHDVLDLKLDAKEAKEGRMSILQELKLLHRSIMRLDDRVRYQQDLPERVDKLEQDVYDLKRKIHNKTRVQ
jgi:peptidoglycan hydrolase CwlO-like protein